VDSSFQEGLPKDAPVAHSNISIQYVAAYEIGAASPASLESNGIKYGLLKWEIPATKDLILSPNPGHLFIAHPGDSIHIYYSKNKIVYSGKNEDQPKFSFINKLIAINGQLAKPTTSCFDVHTLDDYLQWNRYVDQKQEWQATLFENHRDSMPASEFAYYKAQAMCNAENERLSAFGSLMAYTKKDSLSTLKTSDFCRIWDSTQYKIWSQWIRSLSAYHGSLHYVYAFNRLEIARKFYFNYKTDSLAKKELRTYSYYNNAKEKYLDQLRERLLVFILDEQTITEMGLKNPMTQKILADYYSQPGFPEYKAYVKSLEARARK
jgi:hypothetical protein